MQQPNISDRILIRHEGHTPRERSTCGWRDRLIGREDVGYAARQPWGHRNPPPTPWQAA